MEITKSQVIPHLAPVKHNCTLDLLHQGWCYEKTHFCFAQLQELYHLLEFPVMLALTVRGHYASSEEAFFLMLIKLATIDSNVELADCFGLSGDVMVSLI